MPEPPNLLSGHPWKRLLVAAACIICLVGIGWAFYMLYTGRPRFGASMGRPTINAVTPPTEMPHIATPDAVALRNKAMAEWKGSNREEAMADISKAIKADPSWGDPYAVRGGWEAVQGNNSAALKDLNQCIERKPGAPVMIAAFSERARVKQALGDNAGAAKDREEVQILQNKEHH